MKKEHRIARITLQALVLIAVPVLTSGCYILSQSLPFLGDRIGAKPVEQLLNSPHASSETKHFLRRVNRIRSYARNEFGLNASKNFTTYTQLERNHLAYIVYAAGELSFEQHLWNFPITGEVPYKGFYQLSKARKEEQKLKDKGYDTWVGAVDAFSSLGFFKDPLYSFMRDYSDYRLAELIIHEMVHETVWVKDHSAFNEQLASFVAETAAKKYVKAVHGDHSEQFLAIGKTEQDRSTWQELLRNLRSRLEQMYTASNLSLDEKRQEKERMINAFHERLREEYDQLFLTDRYRYLTDITINNAFIAMHGVYYDRKDNLLQRFYEFCGKDLRKMCFQLSSLDGTRQDPREFIRRQLSD
ncbi:MAG: aminopeptidase [Spirochaetota bacterium]